MSPLMIAMGVLVVGTAAVAAHSTKLTMTDVADRGCDAYPKWTSPQRIRKEVRSLSTGEWEAFVAAMWEIRTLPTEEGQAKYGPAFRNMDYFVYQHAAITQDARGDQGHAHAAFITWHDVFLYEFENCLLTVAPELHGLPYWDVSGDNDIMWTGKYFGSFPGTGPSWTVVDGAFAHWPISEMHPERFEGLLSNASTTKFVGNANGLMRNNTNTNANVILTRYGPSNWTYPASNGNTCVNVGGSWMDWYLCMEMGFTTKGPAVPHAGDISPTSDFSALMHAGPHMFMGGRHPTDANNTGDFEDISCSPNEPLFGPLHANIDRHKYAWMSLNPSIAKDFYHFPASAEEGAYAVGTQAWMGTYYGISLFDELANLWGYNSTYLGLQDFFPVDRQWTNADALCIFSPGHSPVVYDSLDFSATRSASAAH